MPLVIHIELVKGSYCWGASTRLAELLLLDCCFTWTSERGFSDEGGYSSFKCFDKSWILVLVVIGSLKSPLQESTMLVEILYQTLSVLCCLANVISLF